MTRFVSGVVVGALAGFAGVQATEPKSPPAAEQAPVRLGNFSVSLTVKDLEASRVFYEKLGFTKIGGDATKNWLILGNDSARVGIFKGMFERNMLTFNPGWDRDKKELEDFDDVREIQKALKQRGLTFTMSADESTTGPGYFMLADPDGNPILVDQHVPSPKK